MLLSFPDLLTPTTFKSQCVYKRLRECLVCTPARDAEKEDTKDVSAPQMLYSITRANEQLEKNPKAGSVLPNLHLSVERLFLKEESQNILSLVIKLNRNQLGKFSAS